MKLGADLKEPNALQRPPGASHPMTKRNLFLPAAVALILPFAAAMTISPAAAQSQRTHKATHHVHKSAHKAKTHVTPAPAAKPAG